MARAPTIQRSGRIHVWAVGRGAVLLTVAWAVWWQWTCLHEKAVAVLAATVYAALEFSWCVAPGPGPARAPSACVLYMLLSHMWNQSTACTVVGGSGKGGVVDCGVDRAAAW